MTARSGWNTARPCRRWNRLPRPARCLAFEQRPLTLREKLSYGFGDLGFSLPYNMASGFLLYYYINVVGLPAAAVGTIFLVARLLDAVIDLLVGIAIDRTRSRWGRTRPYFLFTALPYALLFVAVFAVPGWWADCAAGLCLPDLQGAGHSDVASARSPIPR